MNLFRLVRNVFFEKQGQTVCSTCLIKATTGALCGWRVRVERGLTTLKLNITCRRRFRKVQKKTYNLLLKYFSYRIHKKRTLVTLVVVWKKLNELWQCYLKLSNARYVNKSTGRHLQFTVKDKINWQIETGLFWTTLNKLHIHKRS